MLKSMLTRLRETRMQEIEGDGAAEAGFTLIELMVVLLIIAILLAIAIPTFLGVANSAGDRAAQSNLTNALTEVKALYQNSASYNQTANTPMTAVNEFLGSAPEFAWVDNTACNTSPGNCVSVKVVDSSAGNDSQGVELAVYSAKTTTCWYAVDLESTPSTLVGDSGVPFSIAGHAPQFATTAGVFYGMKTGAAAQAACNAGYPSQTSVAFKWGVSYSAAPAGN
ncbi:MAG TPA: prepilin-type N-terminal cleavage/methylation domain-containing protein [Acidimicrobiales bacterium]